ncbi:MAG: hypothetical protein ACI8YQ_004329 [Polaribacter sp.]|jgi:hypothetical protein
MLEKRNNNFLVILLFLFVANSVFAQPKINSPYSRVALGDLETQNFAALNGMGNLAASYNDFAHANYRNPAALSFLQTTAFELGIKARYGELELNDQQADVWSGNLSYISLAFPVRNISSRILDRDKSPIYWGMGFSLQPYSTVGYEVQTISSDQQINGDTVINSSLGNGGTYQMQWGHGVHYRWSNDNDTTVHKLALGGSIGFLFGSIEKSQAVDFINLDNYYFNLTENDASIRGLLWNLGMQYEYAFQNKNKSIRNIDRSRLTVGIYGHSGTKMDINTDRLTRRRNLAYATSLTSALDTIPAGTFTDSLFNGRLPAEFGLGTTYRFRHGKATWRVGADFSFARWSKYYNESNGEEKGDLEDAYTVAVGAEYVPNAYQSLNNYFETVKYRFGVFYERDPRGGANVGINESLTRRGITLGLGFPIILKNETSFVNLAFEMGRLDGDGAIKDTYGKVTLGFTFNDSNWFYKRKFN